jgi:hypothetical protein
LFEAHSYAQAAEDAPVVLEAEAHVVDAQARRDILRYFDVWGAGHQKFR